MASLPEIGFLRRVLYFKDVEEPVLLALWPSFRERRRPDPEKFGR